MEAPAAPGFQRYIQVEGTIMKKLYWIICVVAVTVKMTWSGYSFGKSFQLKDILIADNIITDELISASQNILLLEMLSEGNIDKAISQLNYRLDTQILIVNNFLSKDRNLEGRRIANYIFLRIAKYRNEYPRDKTGDDFDKSVNEFLTELLNKPQQKTE